MDDKHAPHGSYAGQVPPYEANPTSYPQHAPMQHADSYGQAPAGQPMVQQDIYQAPPISPMQTGTTTTAPGQYPQQPLGASQPMGSPMEHPKGDYYGAQQQQNIPMQQVQSQPMMQHQQSQYHNAIPLQNLQEAAAPVDCPCCHHRALTCVEHHAGNTTHLWGLVICACFCLGCIPYLIKSIKDVEHKCGHCGVMLATWKRSGRTVVHQFS